jgi:transcriptional regulator with XRE-family HTH domain
MKTNNEMYSEGDNVRKGEENQEHSSILDDFLGSIPPAVQRAVTKKMDVAVRIRETLDQKGWTQKDLARKTGKSESEVSRWLSGKQNFTLDSLFLIEEALGAEIIQIPTLAKPSRRDARQSISKLGWQKHQSLFAASGDALFLPEHFSRAISIDHFSLQPLTFHDRNH